MTQLDRVQLLDEYANWFVRRGMDTTAVLTWDRTPGKKISRPPSSVDMAKRQVTKFFSRIKFRGDYMAYVETNSDGDGFHVHVVCAIGEMSRDRMERSWRLEHGIAQVKEAGRDKNRRLGSDDSYTYVAGKFAADGRSGNRIFGRMGGKHLC